MDPKTNQAIIQQHDSSEKTKATGGILIVFFAACMAIAQTLNNNLEEKMMISHNKMVGYAEWYQAKSIKQNMKEGEIAYLEALLQTNMIDGEQAGTIRKKIAESQEKVNKYEAEKTEIFMGSANIPKEYWSQDLDGEMGKIIGMREWESRAEEYESATKKFDIASVFFQIAIILGAVCILMGNSSKLQLKFIYLMIGAGLIAMGIAIYGFIMAP